MGLIFYSCSNYTPKPHGYPKIEFPEKQYTQFKGAAPFSFEIPTYAVMQSDTDQNSEAYWYNLQIPTFDATLHLSYKHFNQASTLDRLTEDAYELAMKHNVKAEDIHETEIRDTVKGNYGVLYDFFGKTATPFNFFLTDEKEHYIRGAFYFNQNANIDSVAPIFDFLKSDLLRLINTLEWESTTID
jgi:gliding motility-associated lipoprotein GldD